jgi:hypothetical protein
LRPSEPSRAAVEVQEELFARCTLASLCTGRTGLLETNGLKCLKCLRSTRFTRHTHTPPRPPSPTRFRATAAS